MLDDVPRKQYSCPRRVNIECSVWKMRIHTESVPSGGKLDIPGPGLGITRPNRADGNDGDDGENVEDEAGGVGGDGGCGAGRCCTNRLLHVQIDYHRTYTISVHNPYNSCLPHHLVLRVVGGDRGTRSDIDWNVGRFAIFLMPASNPVLMLMCKIVEFISKETEWGISIDLCSP